MLRVLDAGCGRDTVSRGIPADAYVVGLDISADLLAQNTGIREAICADLQTYRLDPESFDLIVCHDVLEHLDRPRDALENLMQALRPGGELRIACPNVWSGKGLVTKLTPHSFHVWVYRRVLGRSDAGKSHGPFPTPMRLAIAPHAISKFAGERGFHVDVRVESGSIPPSLPRTLRPLWRVLARNSEARLTVTYDAVADMPDYDQTAALISSERMRTKKPVRQFLIEHGFSVITNPDSADPWTRDYLYGSQ